MHTQIKKFLGSKKGQGLVEYALILGLILVVVIGAINILGLQTSKAFSTVTSGMATAGL